MNGHRTVVLQHPDVGKVHIDTLMADLIRECWRLGIETSECCQEATHGMARIGFLSLADMECFYDLATGDDEDEPLFFGWKWELWANCGLRGTVHFPASEIGWLTTQLAAQSSVGAPQ